MAGLIEYHIPEAIQIRVVKYDQCTNDHHRSLSPRSATSPADGNNKFCNFCVDPQLTSFAVLQSFVVRGFSLQGDFSLFYLDRLTQKNVRIQCDADLQKAFIRAGHPYLEIILYEIDYKTELTKNSELTMSVGDGGQWQQLGKNINRYRNILSEWDVVTSSDVILAQTLSKTNSFICQQIEKLKERAKHLNKGTVANNSWYLAETIYQYIISGDEQQTEPLNDTDFRAFQDSEGRILSFRDLRIAIYRRGVDHSLRKVIWKHLLNVYPENYTGQERLDFIRMRSETYRQMKELWIKNRFTDPEVKKLCHMIRKDVFRTDRTHPFFACSKTIDDVDGEENPNVTRLFNILTTYALNHKHRYCQGMSDLASPLLYVMKDEAQAYIAFCALMNRAGENFALDGQGMACKFEKLTLLLKHYDPEFYTYLAAHQAEELIFCYRWMLLDLKREFPFDDSLEMLEVLWASIPPNTCAYQNLFDEGYVYVPNSIPINENSGDKSTMAQTGDERHIAINNVLDSPISEDGNGLNLKQFVHPKPWNSPSRRRASTQDIEKPSMELYFCCSTEFESQTTTDGTVTFNGSKSKSSTSKTTRSDDGVSSCSTFDSGIQRSNTLSDESVKSMPVSGNHHHNPANNNNNNKNGHGTHSKHFMGVHCNGDFSDEDEHGLNAVEGPIDECFVADEEILRRMSEESESKNTPMMSRLLTVGQSFDYDCNDPFTDSIDTILHQESESYAHADSKLSKSISEEVLNQLNFDDDETEEGDDDDDDDDEDTEHQEVSNDQQNTLNVNAEDLDCLSSSSTSSLVILNKTCKRNEPLVEMLQATLLPPDQIGSNDAFMLFMCLTILLQNRDKIMQLKMDSNDIQLFFDNMIRKHNSRSVLNDARNLFHTYLSQWHKECLS